MFSRQLEFYSRYTYHSIKGKRSLFVLAYPRSGSSWLSRMLSSATNLPYGRDYSFFGPQIIHSHRFFLSSMSCTRTAYLVRDVRDVFLSYANALFFDLQRGLIDERQLHRYYGIMSNGLDPNEAEFKNFVCRLVASKYISVNWVEHIHKAQMLGLAYVRYEDLRFNTADTLENLIKNLGLNTDNDLENVVTSHSLVKEKLQKNVQMNVREGETERWRQYENCNWVDYVSNWAAQELRTFGYDV